jgi:hypothetical protein
VIDKTINTFELPKGSLYSPLPIPAYKVLGAAKQWQAQKVLIALVSHMGKSNNCVFPSYTTIAKVAGMSRKSISAGLNVLFEYEFIKAARFREGKKSRRKYYIQPSCWNINLMTNEARAISRAFSPLIARCLACGEGLGRSDFDFGALGMVHWGCGGFAEYLNSYLEKRPDLES